MEIEIITEIRNKLTPAKTALALLSQSKDAPKKFAEKARKDMNNAIRLLD